MASAVNQYRLYCRDEAAFVTTWAPTEPSACPHSAAHSIDAAMTCVVDTVSRAAVTIDSKSYSGTQGYYLMEGDKMAVAGGAPGGTTTATKTFELPARVYGVQLYADDGNVGDRVDLTLNPATPVGALTQGAAAGAATFAVDASTLQHAVPGFFITLHDFATGTVHEAGRLLALDAGAGTITCASPLPAGAALGVGTTQVALTVYVARNLHLPRATTYEVGYGSMGSKPLPAGTTCAIHYHNEDGQPKSLCYVIEYTY